jgi:SpoVK/Ycf46/Vps4 family AAA+-type ATPase
MKIDEIRSEFITLMRARKGLIALETFEEIRAMNLIKQIAGDPNVNREVFCWSITNGLKPIYPEPEKEEPGSAIGDPMSALTEIESAKTNGTGKIFILLDFNKYLEEPTILRKIRDLSITLKNSKKSVFFISPSFPIPGDLSKSIAIFDLPFPSKEEIEERIDLVLNGIKVQIRNEREKLASLPDEKQKAPIREKLAKLVKVEQKIFAQWAENKTALIDSCLGLSDDEIEDIISRSLVKGDLKISQILTEKKQIIKKSGSLEYFDTQETMSAIGGLANLKKYARRASKMFSKEARDYGIAAPRGILLVGAPGTGKSLFAKAISNEMNQPLLKMDMTAQRSKWFGETGQSMIRALKTAHAIQPAILWIDEIDKSISRSEGMSMHEESAGTLGTLLTDMEEKPGLFFLATCNNPVNLPPELLSRFQKIFFVDLPNESERSEIFAIQIAGVSRDPKNFDLAKLAEKAPGYSGREIRNIIGESLSIAFDENRDFNTDLIINQISKITPVSVQKKSEIESMRAWSAKNAENASESAPVKIESGSRSLEL